jgi:hypothetical protein
MSEKEYTWCMIDNTRMLSFTTSPGEIRSTITHPGRATSLRLSPED